MNPAVTAALFILGKISFAHSLLYFVAQTLGAAFGAGIMYMVHSGKFLFIFEVFQFQFDEF